MDNVADVAYAPFVSNTGTQQARASLLPWVALLMSYGLIIPNSARRATIVSGMIMAAAITSMLCLWLRLELRPGQLSSWVTMMVIWIGMAFAITVYASSRLDEGRRAIAEVRKLGQYRMARGIL